MMNETGNEPESLLAFLTRSGVTLGRSNALPENHKFGGTVSIRMGGRVAFVHERIQTDGKVRVILTHQTSRGNEYQRFGSRERAVKAILAAK